MNLRERLDRYSIPVVAAGTVLVFIIVGYFYNLTGWRIYDDEGEYLYQVWRITEGSLPYRDFLTPQLPLFLFSGSTIMKLAGGSLVAMRTYSVLLAFGTAGFLLIIGRRFSGLLTGMLAAILFLLHSDVFRETRIFRNEPLFLFLITGGLLATSWSQESGRRTRLALAGLLFGLATLVKLFGVLPAGGIALWLTWEAWRKRVRIQTLTADLAAFLLPLATAITLVALLFIALEPKFLDYVLGHHLDQGSQLSTLEIAADKLQLFIQYFRGHPVYLAIAFVSAGLALANEDRYQLWTWQVPLMLAFLILSRQLGQRHFMFLIPAFSILAARILASSFQDRDRPILRLGALFALIMIMWPWVKLNFDRAGWKDEATGQIVDSIEELTDSDELILADDIGLAFYSKRQTTFSGAALSHGAVTSGQITGEQLITEITDKDVQLVIVDESLLTGNHLVFLRDYPRFHRFLEANFEPQPLYRRDFQELRLWTRNDKYPWIVDDPVSIQFPYPEDVLFGDSIHFQGYSLEESSIAPGETLKFTLFWKADGPASNYWSVFTHLLDQEDNLVGQHDKVPYGGLYPPDRWWPGQLVDDKFEITISEDAHVGDYDLTFGMYDFITGERLRLHTSSGKDIANNQLHLDQFIKVTKR